jgi:hypothetical protein
VHKVVISIIATCLLIATAFAQNSKKKEEPIPPTIEELYLDTNERPDFLRRWVGLIKQKNSGDHDLKRAIENFGLMELSSDELYELEAHVKKILAPIVKEKFSDSVGNYDIVFIASDDFRTGITLYNLGQKQAANRDPVIVLDQKVWSLSEDEDSLKFVMLHEFREAFRHAEIKEGWFERLLNNLEKEMRIDAMALKDMIDTGASPLGGYGFLKRMAEVSNTNSDIYRDNETRFLGDGLASHPPGPVRVTRAAGIVEEISQRQDFPPLTPLNVLEVKAKNAPSNPRRWHVAQLRWELAAMLDPGIQFQYLGRFFTGNFYDDDTVYQYYASLGFENGQSVLPDRPSFYDSNKKFIGWNEIRKRHAANVIAHREGYLPRVVNRGMALDLLDSETSTIISRITPRSLKLVADGKRNIPEGWEGIASNFNHMWAAIPTPWKKDADFISIFRKKEKELHARAKKWGGTFESIDEKILSDLRDQQKIVNAVELLKWAKRNPISRAFDETISRQSERYLQERTIPSYSIVENPTLVYDAFSHYIDVAPKIAQEILGVPVPRNEQLQALRDYRDSLYALLISVIYHPDPSEIRRFRREREKWDAKIEKLSISNDLKFALFPPAIIQDFGFEPPRDEPDTKSPRHWGFSWSHEFANSTEGSRELRGDPFFASSVKFLSAQRSKNEFSKFHRQLEQIQKINGITSLNTFQYNPWSGSRASGYEIFDFSGVSDWIYDTLAQFDLTADDVRTIAHSDFYWKKPYALYKAIRTNYFYDRPEYRISPKAAAKLQQLIYSSLKKLGGIPSELKAEIELWKTFAKRAVTDFTDEWAESIVARAMQNREANAELFLNLFRSQLIWDINIRAKLAEFVFSRGLTKASRALLKAKPGQPREKQIGEWIREVINYFPEQSDERANVIDIMANRVLTNFPETELMLTKISGATSDKFGDITRQEAIGQRFYSQLIGEIRSADLRHQVEFLDFMLGKTDKEPFVFSQSFTRELRDKLNTWRLALEAVDTYFGPYRLRRMFQSLSMDVRTGLIDPLFTLSTGIAQQPEGREWVIRTIVPGEPSWKKMGVDLVDGYMDGLKKLGREHLETLFLSYLVASTTKSRSGQYNGLFPWPADSQEVVSSHEGKILKTIFQANSALMKIGQQLHSSHILPTEHNEALRILKESSQKISRHQYFSWIETSSKDDQVLQKVKLRDLKGNASVKGVASVTIGEENLILHLVRPNAARMGNADFALLQHALQFAFQKGHWQLGLVQPMIERGRMTFNKEIDMNQEREAARKITEIYKPTKSYGENVFFVTPEQVELSGTLFKPDRAAAVVELQVSRLTDLPQEELRIFAEAIAEKENEVLTAEKKTRDEIITFEKDRHEGNFMVVNDPEFLKRIGLEGKRVCLVIDPAQVSQISAELQQATLEGLALTGAYKHRLLNQPKFVADLSALISTNLAKSKNVQQEAISRSIRDALSLAEEKGVGELYSSILAFVEAGGKKPTAESIVQLREEVWDFVKALQTNQTWDQYTADGFTPRFIRTMTPRVMKKMTFFSGLKNFASGNVSSDCPAAVAKFAPL